MISCSNKKENSITSKNKTDTIKLIQKKESQNPKFDTILNEEKIIILGDSNISKEKITEIYVKFEPYITFDDFIVNIENVKAKLDLDSHKNGREYRTKIRNCYNDFENLFAGHYTLASIGCGNYLQINFLIDRRTGKIYNAPDSRLGIEYKKNSRMLIINPTDSSRYYLNNSTYSTPEIYILNEITKKFEKKEQY